MSKMRGFISDGSMEIDPQVQRMFPFLSWLKLNCKKYYTVSDKKDGERDFPGSAVAWGLHASPTSISRQKLQRT